MAEYKSTKEKIITGEEFIEQGEKRGYILISRDRSKITYRTTGKRFNFKDQKEKVRAYFLVKLIDKYKYTEERIKLDVEVPGYKLTNTADLVVYQDDFHAYILVECRKPGMKKSEIEKVKKEAIKKAIALKTKYVAIVIGSRQFVFEIDEKPKEISDIPINYGRE